MRNIDSLFIDLQFCQDRGNLLEVKSVGRTFLWKTRNTHPRRVYEPLCPGLLLRV